MAEEENTKNNEYTQKVEQEVKSPRMGFQTMPMITELTDSEKLSRIEAVLDEISMKMGDEEDARFSYDQIIECFNLMKKSCDDLKVSLDNEVQYTRNLKDKLKRRECEYENIQLKSLLNEERSKMTLAFETYSTTIRDGITYIQTKMELLEKAFNDKCDVYDSKLDEFKAEKDSVQAMKDQLQKMIEDFREDLNTESDKEYKKITNDCSNVLEACNQRMSEVKTDVITFLKACQSQNKDIIGKIPEQKRKFSWKDILVYAVCTTSLLCNLIVAFH